MLAQSLGFCSSILEEPEHEVVQASGPFRLSFPGSTSSQHFPRTAPVISTGLTCCHPRSLGLLIPLDLHLLFQNTIQQSTQFPFDDLVYHNVGHERNGLLYIAATMWTSVILNDLSVVQATTFQLTLLIRIHSHEQGPQNVCLVTEPDQKRSESKHRSYPQGTSACGAPRMCEQL